MTRENVLRRQADRAQRLASIGRVAQQAFAVLEEAREPLTAYELLWRLQLKRGKRAPPSTIYRSLAALADAGLVHRVGALGAFVVCAMPEITHEPAFLICEHCKGVTEIDATPIAAALRAVITEHGFRVDRLSLDAGGACASCGRNRR